MLGTAGSRIGRAARLSLVALATCFALAPTPAHATFPGANGKLAFGGVSTINPDGSGAALIDSGHGSNPRWRPDGQKIAVHTYQNQNGAWLMNPDGSDVQPLSTTNPNAYVDTWSPDGQRIAYSLPVDGYPDYGLTES